MFVGSLDHTAKTVEAARVAVLEPKDAADLARMKSTFVAHATLVRRALELRAELPPESEEGVVAHILASPDLKRTDSFATPAKKRPRVA